MGSDGGLILRERGRGILVGDMAKMSIFFSFYCTSNIDKHAASTL